jgi:hypothetical protein
MKTLKQLLANKNRPLAVVAPGDSVFSRPYGYVTK